jgi:hypothetical protein
MTESQEHGSRNYVSSRKLFIVLFAFVALAAVAFYTYSSTCPCDGTPGGILLGERVDEPISDWSMVNEVDICQLQIAAGIRPHSLNLNCWAAEDGSLYVGCMGCEGKYWGYRVSPGEKGFIRVDGRVYPVTIDRIENPDEMDRIWRTRFYKLGQRSPEPVAETPRDEGWWTFSLVSR